MQSWRHVAGFTALALSLLFGAASFAQVGHPAKGSWVGFWGPEQDQRRLVLDLDWKNPAVTAVINPGPKAVKASRVDIDYASWTLVIEADLPDKAGKPVKWQATGKLENLGSWSNRRYSGTYRYGGETGKFSVALH
jgi:hypothetical protein